LPKIGERERERKRERERERERRLKNNAIMFVTGLYILCVLWTKRAVVLA
jgi:hypothetical protein